MQHKVYKNVMNTANIVNNKWRAIVELLKHKHKHKWCAIVKLLKHTETKTEEIFTVNIGKKITLLTHYSSKMSYYAKGQKQMTLNFRKSLHTMQQNKD